MADASKSRHSRQAQPKDKCQRDEDPGEGSSKGRAAKTRAIGTPSSSRPVASKPSREEERRHKAIEKAFLKAQATSTLALCIPPETQPCSSLIEAQPCLSSPMAGPANLPSLQRPVPALSPDRSVHGELAGDSEVESVFPVVQQPPVASEPEQPVPETSSSNGPTQSPQAFHDIPPALAVLISEAIRHGISQGLQQRSSSEASVHSCTHQASREPTCQEDVEDSREVGDTVDSLEEAREVGDTVDSASHDSLSDGEIVADHDLSDDEGLEPDQPSFIGLFRPQMFRSLLYKAQMVTHLGGASATTQSSSSSVDATSSLFQEPTVQKGVVPAPKLFSDVVLRQWSFPSSGPVPNNLDKRFYNMAPDFSHLLQVPSVDAPVLALSSASPLTGPSEKCLHPEEKKAEKTLIKGHQASAWAIQASSVASFFNRATILWLRQLQARLPPSDQRSHQDLNKILAAVEFSADATLNAARFSAKAIGTSVTSRRLLWLRNWQADIRSKWRLASSPFVGEKLFGSQLDPLLIETKDHRKVLPALNRRPDN